MGHDAVDDVPQLGCSGVDELDAANEDESFQHSLDGRERRTVRRIDVDPALGREDRLDLLVVPFQDPRRDLVG